MTSRLPPGQTTAVSAQRVLVLAPHFDDEVLGCGGLLLQLAAAGATVGVLFLTNSVATAGEGEDKAEHSRRRRDEAAAAGEVLGITSAEFLELPDGGLVTHLVAAAQGIEAALARHRPDLVLVPSPHELTADHRATFAALHRVLSSVREESPGPVDADLVARLTVLAYEVNRPLYPDLLVDVSREQPTIEAAMSRYSSQERLHPYLNSRQGLSRYRTLSLAPGIEAAEAYNRLSANDFITRSHAQLVRFLGAEPERNLLLSGPLISVVVRTKDRPQLLAQALESVAASTYRQLEVVLVNDGGVRPQLAEEFPFPLVRVELPENRGRARAAQAGVEAANGEFVAFLDDDDLVAPEHFATLAGLVSAAGVRVAYTDAAVGVYELDAGAGGSEAGWKNVERRLPYSRNFDRELLLLDNYIPFHTLVIERSLFAAVGAFDAELPFFEDWDFLIRLSALVTFHHLPQVTCEYRHFRGAAHHILGAAAQPDAEFSAMKAKVLAKHQGVMSPALLAAAIGRLRAELVALSESRDAGRRELKASAGELASLRREHTELAQEHFRKNGELVAAQGDLRRMVAELEASGRELARLHGEEQRLTADSTRLERDLKSQTELVGRLYAEVSRLGDQIRAMETTRAWRFHQWWQRRFRSPSGR